MDVRKFYKALLLGKTDEVKKLTEEALEAGETAEAILKGGFIPGMELVGTNFKNFEIYIPELLVAARAMQAGMAILKPILSKSKSTVAARVIIGTVKNDFHDIGKKLVVLMLEGGGFEVIDLGIDVSADNFVESIRIHQPQVVGMSALLTTTVGEMANTLKAVKEAGLRKQVKMIVGGTPVTERFAIEIGADGYAPDAVSAVDLVKSLLSRQII